MYFIVFTRRSGDFFPHPDYTIENEKRTGSSLTKTIYRGMKHRPKHDFGFAGLHVDVG